MASSSNPNPQLNRLALSKSPYLLQHASNPILPPTSRSLLAQVDWYEWTPEAFALAQEHDKPIFLSVGYSACHWCHVLAHESFEDNDVAAIMNEHFVNIKVDREERPDVDSLYMTFLQATSGGGGWPMSVFLTPSLKPFFAGTYFPRPEFSSLLRQISTLWQTKREDVVSSADDILEQLRTISTSSKQTSGDFDANKMASTAASKIFAHLFTNFDYRHGGFSTRGPKFPSPAQSLDFLVAYAAQAIQPPTHSGELDGESSGPRGHAAYMAVRTLRGIWEGGIHDHVGGGVARYSVDERWHVPHFEKMLYDQGQLARTALLLSLLPDELLSAVPPASSSLVHVPEAPRKMLRDLACNILTYAEHDLLDKSPGRGAFWSAEDADSKERFNSTAESSAREAVGPSLEGAFYAWTAQEIEQVLKDTSDVNGIAPASLFKERYGVEVSGNVDAKNDIQGELTGKNVLYEAVSLRSLADKHQLDEDTVRRSLEQSLARLYSWRNEHRPRPHLDDKVVLAWNGLMISAYALAHCALPPDGSYPIQNRAIAIAENIVSFIEENMLDSNTMHLVRTWRNGHPGPRAQADDHAFFIRGLLDLYEACGKEKYLILAIKLQQRQDDLFWDDEGGGYFSSVKDEHILLRSKDAQDGAEPSAVSITLSNLARLSHFDTVQTEKYNSKILRTFGSIAPLLAAAPTALATSVIALMQQVAGYRQFIVQGSPASPQVQAYLEILHRYAFIPNRVLIHLDPERPPHELAARNAVVKSLVDDIQERKRQGKHIEENVRLCEGFACQLPVADLAGVKRIVAQTF